MKKTQSATGVCLTQVHGAVLFFGMSGLFAKWIGLPAVIIAFGRVFFSVLFLLLLLRLRKTPMRVEKRSDWLLLASAGIFLAVHWISFYQSIQLSTVAIGTITFATYPLFVTFLEPFFFKEKLRLSQVIAAVAMLGGVCILVPLSDWGGSTWQGILWGMLSSVTYGVFSLFNRLLVVQHTPLKVAFFEQAVAAAVLFPFLLILRPTITILDFWLLALVGTVFTALPHTLFISGLQRVKAQTAGIISGLESVYSIAAAFLFLGESPGARAILGGGVILFTTLFSGIWEARTMRNPEALSLHSPENKV